MGILDDNTDKINEHATHKISLLNKVNDCINEILQSNTNRVQRFVLLIITTIGFIFKIKLKRCRVVDQPENTYQEVLEEVMNIDELYTVSDLKLDKDD